MARGRIITKDASVDPELNSISQDAMLLYLLTLPHLDRDGLIDGTPMRLAAMAAPLQPNIRDRAGACINEWIDAGLVVRYGSAHRPTLFFHGFRKHQVDLNYGSEPPSRYPPPPDWIRTKEGLVPNDTELCFRLADGFHARSAYRRALLRAAGADVPVIEAGDDYLTGDIPITSRTYPDNIPNSSELIKSNHDHGGGGDQSITPSPTVYGNRGGVGGGDLTGYSDKELIVVAYDFGGQLNLVTDWNNYEGYILSLSRGQIIRLIEWIYHYSTQSEKVLSAIESLPAVIRTHMTKEANAGLTTRQRQDIKDLVEKSLRLNQPQPREDDEVDL